MSPATISIITATYNSATHISDCINSVKCQSYPTLEHIIIDGASKDSTLEIIKTAPNRVSSIISEPDKGIYDALNKGVKLATGDIIGFLHSDDIFASPHILQNIADVFLREEKTSIVYGDLVFVDPYNTNKVVRYWKSKPFKPSLLNRGWMPPHPTVFMRREVYDKHGFFNINYKCAADYDYLIRVLKDSKLQSQYIPEVITKMRVGGISTKGFKNILNKKREDYLVLGNNKMPMPLFTLTCKNASKIFQFLV
jgi:glycosyltransferase involved in cell wall biosynthesis